MKHVKLLEDFINEDASKTSELNMKVRALDKKRNELKAKAVDNVAKMRDEDDPLKSELLNLAKQKLVLQAEITKIDMKITAIKIKQESNK